MALRKACAIPARSSPCGSARLLLAHPGRRGSGAPSCRVVTEERTTGRVPSHVRPPVAPTGREAAPFHFAILNTPMFRLPYAIALVLLVALTAAGTGIAWAHPLLLRASPPPDAILQRPPTIVQLV